MHNEYINPGCRTRDTTLLASETRVRYLTVAKKNGRSRKRMRKKGRRQTVNERPCRPNRSRPTNVRQQVRRPRKQTQEDQTSSALRGSPFCGQYSWGFLIDPFEPEAKREWFNVTTTPSTVREEKQRGAKKGHNSCVSGATEVQVTSVSVRTDRLLSLSNLPQSGPKKRGTSAWG